MNLVEYQSEIDCMIETQNFDQRPKLENLATQSPEHQRAWEDFLIVEHTLPAWNQSLPDVDLVEAVISQLTAPQDASLTQPVSGKDSAPHRIKPRSAGRWISASVLTMTALLLVVYFNVLKDDSNLVPPGSVVIKQSAEPALPDQTNTNDNRLNQLLRNAKAASWGLAQSTAGTMTEAVYLVPVTRSTPGPNASTPEESTWVDDINEEMQPLKDQIGHAWNFIIHSVPDESTKI